MKDKKNINTEKLIIDKTKQWQNTNKKAIENYNKRIKQRGLFGDRFRTF